MKKIILTIMVFAFVANISAQLKADATGRVLFPLSLSAEVTREQADAIILEYIQNEVTWNYVLVRNNNLPGEDGKISVTWNNSSLHVESLNVEYPCWVYCIYNPTVDGLHTILFLFVSKEDGSLLEVKNKQAYGANVENWMVIAEGGINVTEKVNKSSNIVISPNPVSDRLNIISDTGISRVEIYDSSGRMLLVEPVQNETNYSLNLSSLPEGWYLLNIVDATGKKIKEHKLIKN
jgi:hypothetical protein